MSAPNPIIISKGSGITTRASNRIPGTFPSVRYGEKVISSGIPSLDSFIGGGIPLGSICIIKDIFPSRYSDCVLKSFIAEGASYNHYIYVASDIENCQEYLLNDLPSLASTSKKSDEGGGHAIDEFNPNAASDMKIAWRYGHQQGAGAVVKDITKFDFSKKTSASDLGATHVTMSSVFGSGQKETLDPVSNRKLLQEIYTVAQNFELDSSTKPPNNLVRICISHCEEQVLSCKFMMGLRTITRHTNASVMLTVSDVSTTAENLSRCEGFADYVISLQAVADDKRRTDLGDIDGICDISKTASVNSLKLVESPRDLGFSFKKKRLIFHELNLPPEGESTTQREVSNNRPSSTSTSTCGTIKGKSIDF